MCENMDRGASVRDSGKPGREVGKEAEAEAEGETEGESEGNGAIGAAKEREGELLS